MKKALFFVLFVAPAMMFAQDGTYEGVGKGGRRGDVAVSVVVKGGKITDIKVTASKEDRPRDAFKRITAAIIKNNNYNVDVVSGASRTSRAFVNAVEAALKGAGIDAQFKGKVIKP